MKGANHSLLLHIFLKCAKESLRPDLRPHVDLALQAVSKGFRRMRRVGLLPPHLRPDEGLLGACWEGYSELFKG